MDVSVYSTPAPSQSADILSANSDGSSDGRDAKLHLSHALRAIRDFEDLPFCSVEYRSRPDYWAVETGDDDLEDMQRGTDYADLLLMFMARERFPSLLGWVLDDLYAKDAAGNGGELERAFVLRISRYAVRGICADERHISRAGQEI